MPALFPIFAIAAVLVFISTHAAVSKPVKKKPKPPSDLAQAIDKMIQASTEAKGQGNSK
ncbi:MAG: hypothetical protein AAFV90_18245 [Cyanobacteria bacterium J06634_5]